MAHGIVCAILKEFEKVASKLYLVYSVCEMIELAGQFYQVESALRMTKEQVLHIRCKMICFRFFKSLLLVLHDTEYNIYNTKYYLLTIITILTILKILTIFTILTVLLYLTILTYTTYNVL